MTGSDAERVKLETDSDRYTIGSDLVLTLRNEGRNMVRAVACGPFLSSWTGSDWSIGTSVSTGACLFVPTIDLPPGQSRSYEVSVDSTKFVPGSKYRFFVGVEASHVLSNTFVVE